MAIENAILEFNNAKEKFLVVLEAEFKKLNESKVHLIEGRIYTTEYGYDGTYERYATSVKIEKDYIILENEKHWLEEVPFSTSEIERLFEVFKAIKYTVVKDKTTFKPFEDAILSKMAEDDFYYPVFVSPTGEIGNYTPGSVEIREFFGITFPSNVEHSYTEPEEMLETMSISEVTEMLNDVSDSDKERVFNKSFIAEMQEIEEDDVKNLPPDIIIKYATYSDKYSKRFALFCKQKRKEFLKSKLTFD